MKTFFKNYFFIVPFLALLLVGCKDDDEPIVDPLEPTITDISPDEGVPGTVVTLTGYFEGVTQVLIDDEEVADFTLAPNDSTITFTVPQDQEEGFVTVTVAREGGSDDVQFTVLGALPDDPEPEITSISPEEGLPGTEVTLEGTLEGVTELNFAGDDLEQFELAEDGNSLTFTVPEGTVTGAIEVRVTNSAGSAETAFTVLSEAAAITFDPASGPVGTEVTISGADFTDATSVLVGDTPITDIEVADDGSTITFEIPEGAETGLVTILGPDDSWESAEEFTVEEAEGITFEPASGPVGTLITLRGMDFTGVTSVMLGDMEITEVEVPTDGSSLTFEVPEGAQTGTIQVEEEETEEEFTVTESAQAINEHGSLEAAEVGVVGEGEGQVTVPGWDFGGNDGTLATFEVVDEPTQEGDRALAVNVVTLGEDPWNIEARQDGIPVSPNTTYNYSVWTRGPAGTSADFTVGRADFSEFEGARARADMTGEWQEISFQFTTDEDDTEIRTPIHLSREGNEGQTVFIDNLQIVPVD